MAGVKLDPAEGTSAGGTYVLGEPNSVGATIFFPLHGSALSLKSG